MPELITDPDAFTALFQAFRHTAFRLEVRRMYGLAYEDEPFQEFLRGGDPGIEWLRPWLELMKEQTGAGKRVERVRVVDDPPSAYLRFEIAVTPHNLAAGEDLRYIQRSKARSLELPDYDYWIFDSSRVVLLRFGEDDRFLGFEEDDDPAAVVQHAYWRDAVWHHALKYDEYLAGYSR